MKTLLLIFALALQAGGAIDKFSARASEIDKRTREHPEIDFVFEKDGKPRDLQHAYFDPSAKPTGQLVIWLMDNNSQLLERTASYGHHSIQVTYAREWFSKMDGNKPQKDEQHLGKIRLEAATGKNHSPHIAIPQPDSLMERSFQFVKWLDKKHPGGKWKQFIARNGRELDWEKVILSGASHGSTTAARLAKEIRVARVVMFSGPRDQFDSWQKLPSATPAERYFGFTHILDDGWKGDHYCRSWLLLGLHHQGPLIDVDETPFPYENTRRLITNADVGNNANRAHSASTPGKQAVKDGSGNMIHEDVWKYLFTHPVGETGKAVEPEDDCNLNLRNDR